MPPPEPEPGIGGVVRRIARRLADPDYGAGGLAELRRLNPAGPLVQPALHRLLVQSEVPEPWLEQKGLQRWALLIHAVALAAPDLHQGQGGLGAALFAAGYKEGRLTRVLEARPQDLPDVIPRMVRFLVAKGERLDPVALAWFIRDVSSGQGSAERARERVARDYYRAEANADKTKQPAEARSIA